MQGMQRQAEEVATEVLSLFLGPAIAAVEASRSSGAPSPVGLLASMMAPRGESPSLLTTAVQVATTVVVTPQLFAALAADSQAILAMVGFWPEVWAVCCV